MATVYSLICWGGKDGKTATMTIASPCVVSVTNHGLRNGTGVVFSTTGALPTGVTAGATYYAYSTGANAFNLYDTAANAIAGGVTGRINTSGTQSGVHTAKSAYYLDLSDKARWTYGGAEYIFGGLSAWNTYHTTTTPASSFDTHYCEIAEAFTEYQDGVALTITVPSAQNIIWTKVGGVRSEGWHSGDFPGVAIPTLIGAGYVYCVNASNGTTNAIALSRYNDIIDGFSVIQTASTGVGSLVALTKGLTVCRSMFLVGYSTATPTRCLWMGSPLSYGIGNVILYGARGIEITNYLSGITVANNVVSHAATGMYATTGPYGFYYNNISIGNTANWAAATLTGVEGATNNAGLAGEAWIVGSGTRVTMATTDFADYANHDFSPATSTSPQVNAGVNFYGYPTSDINDGLRPAYEDGTDAIDIGAHEWDFGNTPPSTDYYGLNFTGLVSGSLVKVFATGTDTELFSTANSSTTETWSVNSSGTATVDYVILRAGYEPIRVTGITVTGGPDGVIDVPVSQVSARWYQASSGLTINTNCFANAATKRFGLTTPSTVQNLASYLLEQWIALGDTGEAYANKPFPLAANGPNSFSWRDGWEADLTTYSVTISNLSRDGMRYLNTSGVATAAWAAILSVGVPAGARVRYQQVEGTTQSAAVTSGNMDELVQIYGDATHGNFDRTGYLTLKVQEAGYDQVEADAVALYGTLEDQLYVVGLTPAANGVATGDPGITGMTITDHGASPVTWNGKQFSITITDSGVNSGTDILRWLRYNFETGGAFQGTDAFNWHDLMQTNGTAFKGVRGKLYGDTGAALKGVRVLRGADAHPHVTLHTADDGTTYSSIAPSSVVAAVLADSRVQLYNVTTATEIENIFVTGTSYSKVITTEASVGDVLRLRVCKKGRMGYQSSLPWQTAGITYLVDQPEDTIYTTWGIDGATVTEYALDGPNLQIDANDVDGATTKVRLGAYYSYALTTEIGIRQFYGALTFLSTAAIRVNTATANLYIENTNATTALRFTDLDVRLYKDDGTSIIAPTSYSIHNDYSGVPDVVETGVSGLTGSESAQLMGLPSADATADAVGARIIEAGYTQDEVTKLLTSILLGKVSGAGTGTERFRDLADTKDRVIATVDESGNRTAITRDAA